jgi:hypothetical protein
VACGNIFDIISGKSEYRSLAEFVEKNPLFAAFRKAQREITDRARPCLLLDNPEKFRHICRTAEYRPAKNMPPGYLDGEIAKAIDERAKEWEQYVAQKLPPLPSQVEAALVQSEPPAERAKAYIP